MTDVRVVKDTIDVKGILAELEYLRKKYPFLRDQNQISLQSHEPNPTPEKDWNCSTGRHKYLGATEEQFIYPIFPEANLINHYMNSLGMTRSRVMRSIPKTCMRMHRDHSPRIHLPLISEENCLMVIDKQGYYLEPGKAYWTDTVKWHTAMNASYDLHRVHIIGCVKGLL